MFAFGKVIFAVILLAIILWFLLEFTFGFIGKLVKNKGRKMKKTFTEDDKEDDVQNG